MHSCLEHLPNAYHALAACQVRSSAFHALPPTPTCAGDGTLRKAPDIWRRWGTANGNGLHSLQLKITLRCAVLYRDCATLRCDVLLLVAAPCVLHPCFPYPPITLPRHLRRACELLRVGGRLVYSTCTFNPVEDEAVVAEVRMLCLLHVLRHCDLWGPLTSPLLCGWPPIELVVGCACQTACPPSAHATPLTLLLCCPAPTPYSSGAAPDQGRL